MDILKERKVDWVVEDLPFPELNFKGYDLLLFERLSKVVNSKKKILIVPDVDTDGVFSAIIMKELLLMMKHSSFDIEKIRERSHTINDKLVRKVIQKYQAVIIVDSSTNELAKLNKMSDYGVEVFVLDHHMPKYKYSDYSRNVTVINTRMINPDWEMSAGALCGYLAFRFSKLLKKPNYEFLVLGALTIFSDSCIIDEINAGIIQEAEKRAMYGYSEYLLPFMTQYDIFNKSFVNYKLSNRLNACFREEEFELINEFILGNCLREDIEQVYLRSRLNLEYIVKRTKVTELNNIVMGVLPDTRNSVNYTGLVGNKLMSANKMAITLHPSLKGSVRDSQQRNILEYFMGFFKCGGHKSAFGFFINYEQTSDFKMFVRTLDDVLLNRPNEDIILEDVSVRDIGLMALFNEFSNNKALIKVNLGRGCTINKYENNTTIKWREMSIKCFTSVSIGDTVYIKPQTSKQGVKLLVESVEI